MLVFLWILAAMGVAYAAKLSVRASVLVVHAGGDSVAAGRQHCCSGR